MGRRAPKKILELPAAGDERIESKTRGKKKLTSKRNMNISLIFGIALFYMDKKKAGQWLRRRTPPDFAAHARARPFGVFVK